MLPAAPFPVVSSQTTRFEVVQREAAAVRAAGAGATATPPARRTRKKRSDQHGVLPFADILGYRQTRSADGARPEGVVTKLSPWPVDETVSRLTELVEAKGLKVFAVVDHSGAAHENGLELRDTRVVIFGSPVAGTPVMEAAPLAALDLPLKVLVWDDAGRTRLDYFSPDALGARYGLDDIAARLAGVDVLTDALLAQA